MLLIFLAHSKFPASSSGAATTAYQGAFVYCVCVCVCVYWYICSWGRINACIVYGINICTHIWA